MSSEILLPPWGTDTMLSKMPKTLPHSWSMRGVSPYSTGGLLGSSSKTKSLQEKPKMPLYHTKPLEA